MPLFCRRFALLATAFALCLPGKAAEEPADNDHSEIDFHGPEAHPGYPNAFNLSYKLRKNSLSPNKQYGVIFPTQALEDKPDFLLDVKNSRVLALIEMEEPYFERKNHGGLTVHWSPDNVAVLVENEGKWSPHDLVLIELKEGKVFRQTELLGPLEKMFSPAVAKAEHTPASESGVETLSVTAVTWKKGKGLQITCEGGTNPKEFAEQDQWEGKLVALWDLAQHKYTEHKVTQTSFRRAHKERE